MIEVIILSTVALVGETCSSAHFIVNDIILHGLKLC